MTQVLIGARCTSSRAQRLPQPPPADEVREAARRLGCRDVWARAAGRHVILGIGDSEAFARVTPVGPGAFGLSFRRSSGEPGSPCPPGWERLLLVDALDPVVEHALIGEGALHKRARSM